MPVLNDYGKLAVFLVAIVASAVLALAGLITGAQALVPIGLILAYTTGNGVLVRRRQPPSPLITSPGTMVSLVDHPGDKVPTAPVAPAAPAPVATAPASPSTGATPALPALELDPFPFETSTPPAGGAVR